MKRRYLLLLMMMIGVYAKAQYTFSGTVRNSSGTPLSGKTVFVKADTTINPKLLPAFNLSDVTDTGGKYSVTLPTSVVNGMYIMSSTVNCNSVLSTKTYQYKGNNIVSDFTVCITPAPTISGQVTLGSGSTAASSAKVWLIRIAEDTIIGSITYYKLTPTDSVIASAVGSYAFSHPGSGQDMLVRAAYQSFSANYSKYAPTYYADTLTWPNASWLPYTSTTPSIKMRQVNTPGGPGYVSGFVVVGAGKSTAVGDPLPNRLILLTDTMDKVYGHTVSASDGTFSFSNLPYGTYKIFGDVFGKTSKPLIFTLSASNPQSKFITFQEKSRTFDPMMPALGIANTTQANIRIYPNPATTAISIDGLQSDAVITIYDIAGRQVMPPATLLHGRLHSINISTLPQGHYTVQLSNNAGTSSLKFVKQ